MVTRVQCLVAVSCLARLLLEVCSLFFFSFNHCQLLIIDAVPSSSFTLMGFLSPFRHTVSYIFGRLTTRSLLPIVYCDVEKNYTFN